MKTDIYNTYNGKAYRFLGFDGFMKTIVNETLRFSRIDTFNDPLDSSPFLHPYAYKKYQEAYAKSKGLKISDFNTYYKSCFNSFFDKSYVCCFSKEYDTDDSYLMWSYYGEKHTQMCFEIDFEKHHLLGAPSNITYAKDLVTSRGFIEDQDAVDRGMFVATTKSKLWEHEKEVRLIVDVENNNVSKNIIFSDDKKYLYYPFDIKIISKVIFAVNSYKCEEEKVMQLMNSKENKPIYKKMVINPDTLKLQSIDYETYIT